MSEDVFKSLSFESDSASYILHAARHEDETNLSQDIIDKIDAIFLESAVSYDEWSAFSLLNDSQYSSIYKENLKCEDPSPLFFVDKPIKSSGLQPGELGEILADKVTSERMLNISSYLQLGNIMSATGKRSAYTAERSEILAEEHFEGQPTILLEYGSSHLDCKQFLEKPYLRKSALELSNLRPYNEPVLKHKFQDIESNHERNITIDGETVEYQTSYIHL